VFRARVRACDITSDNRPVRYSNWFGRGVVGAIVCLLLAGAACRRQGRLRNAREPSGEFDHYVLALAWAPAFCAHETTRRTAGECAAGGERGFVVHGLWPERESGRPLENCAPVRPLPPGIVQQMLPLMPDAALIEHEWRTHGSCSGLTPEDYFATVARAAQKIQIPESYRSLQHTVETSPAEIERRFATVNHLRAPSAVRVHCRAGEVREVRICLTKSLQPRTCSWRMRDCRARELFMRSPHGLENG
jgi:ribonuclease T2